MVLSRLIIMEESNLSELLPVLNQSPVLIVISSKIEKVGI